MLSKRHTELLKLLESEGTIPVAELAARFDVSLETIRRDIKPLVMSGRIVKMHGAVCLSGDMAEAPFQKRARENADAKLLIGKLVAHIIQDGDSVMLDTGTTTSFVARALLGHQRLTVVTNSTDIVRTLAPVNGNKVFMAGGAINSDSGGTLGASAIAFMSQFHVEHAIISAGAIDIAAGVMDYSVEEADLARTMLSCGKKRLVVSDHSKYGKRGLVSVCGLAQVSTFVCDKRPSAEFCAAIDSSTAQLICA